MFYLYYLHIYNNYLVIHNLTCIDVLLKIAFSSKERFFLIGSFVYFLRSLKMIGQTISHYKIIEKLGSGGIGVVYKADDFKLDRLVALKFLSKDFCQNEEYRKRLMQEAKAISTLDHPNIAVVHEVDEVNDQMFICMRYYEGKTLKELITEGPLSIENIYLFGLQIAQGLREAHDAEIIHRDIKPANILITNTGQVKILDFGIAKLLNSAEMTQAGTILGTIAYMSPEQIREEIVDHRTDIFSLGILLYEMTTGENPFKGEYSAAITYSILHEEPTPPRRLRPEIPQAFEELIIKALAKDREKRYQTTIEIATDLKALQSESSKILVGPKIKHTFSLPIRKLPLLGSTLVFALIVTIFFILWPEKSDHNRITSIAVMPFSFEGDKEDWNWLGGAITELLNTDLAQYSSLRVLSAQQRMRIMRSLGLRGSDLSKNEALQVAGKVKIGSVVLGGLRKTGNIIRVQARIFETDTGTLLSEVKPFEGDHSKLYEVVGNLSSQIIKVLNVGAGTNITVGSVAKRITSSLDAFRYYVEGKDAAYDLRHQESIRKLNKSISLDSTFIDAYYWLAWQYSLIQNKVKAKEILTKGKPYISQLSEEARLEYLCNEAKIEGRWKDYAAYLEQLLRINPFDATDHYRYGWTQYRMFRKLDAGIAAMEKSLQLDSTFYYAYNDLGYAYLEKGEPKKALEIIKKYVALNPADINPLDSMAEIQILIGQYDQAISNCERILAIQPDFQYARIHLAQAYLAQGKFTRALTVLEQLMQSATSSKFKSLGQTLRAQIQFSLDEFEEALQFVDKAIASDSTNLEAHWMRGRSLLHLKDRHALEDELGAFRHVLAAQGSLEGMWFLYHLQGEIALQDYDFSTSVELFQKALNLRPSDRSFYLEALANAYEHAGELHIAVKQYNSALAFNPNNAMVAFRLGRTYEKLGEFAKAKQAYNKVLEIWSDTEEKIEELGIAKRKLSTLNLSTKN